MRRTTLLAALAAVTVPALDAPPAHAAPAAMTVYACGTPEQALGAPAGWTAEPSVGAFSEAAVRCSTDGTMTANNGAAKFASTTYAFRSGEGAALNLSVPADWSISRFLLVASASASSRNGDMDYGAMEMYPSLTGNISGSLDVCKAVPGIGCFAGPSNFGMTTYTGLSQYFDLDETALRLDVRCGSDTRCNAPGSEPIGITVDRTEIDLVEAAPEAPSVTQVGGSLVSDGVLTGTETVTFDATDNAAGVYRLIVTAGGKQVAVPFEDSWETCADVRPGAEGAYEFASTAPCPRSGSFVAKVNTAALPEGTGELTVAVEDATGLRRRVAGARSVRVDNVPSPDDGPTGGGAPTGGTAGTGSGGGLGTPDNGVHASNRARIVLGGRRTRTLPFGRSLRATATLRDEHGRGISGARVTVLQRTSVPGARWVPARGPLVTDAKGRLRWTVPAGHGRTVRLAYKANLANADFQATSDLVLRVRSKTTFTTNRASFRNGQTIRFSGRLRSLPVPKGGVGIDLQARVGSKWQTFRTVRTTARGTWKASYRFRSTSGVQRYTFRARVGKDTGFPYLASRSRTRSVTVRG